WLVWKNVEIMIIDVPGLDGIFGMNLLVSAVTLDPNDPLSSLFDISPGAFTAIVIDTTDAASRGMRLSIPAAAGTVWGWLGENFTLAERALPAVGSANGDAVGDGVPNLLKYALGLAPRERSSASMLPSGDVVAAGADRFLALRYARPVGGRQDVSYHVEISHDLINLRRETGLNEIVLHRSEVEAGSGSRSVWTSRLLRVENGFHRIKGHDEMSKLIRRGVAPPPLPEQYCFGSIPKL
ncbi:MAG: hypothetical protein EAZ36_04200, partial [Verrucomicrobia bacterium]